MNTTNLVIGKVETGKTRGICFQAIQDAIRNDKNLFILDNKQEYYPRFKQELEEKVYTTWLINLRDPLKSNGINILKYPYLLYKSGNKDTAITLITSISHNICVSHTGDFWENSAADYLSSLILILFDVYDLSEINFMNLELLINLMDNEINFELLKNYLSRLSVTSLIYKLGSATIFAPTDTRGGIISTLKYRINAFFNREEVLKTLSLDEIDIDNLDNKVAIFFEGKSGLNGIANILIEQLLVANRALHNEFFLMLDNFNTLPKLSFIDELIDYHSLYNMKTYFVTNCFDELIEMYGKFKFDKIPNVINMEEIRDIEIDSTNKEILYPERKEFLLKQIDIQALSND